MKPTKILIRCKAPLEPLVVYGYNDHDEVLFKFSVKTLEEVAPALERAGVEQLYKYEAVSTSMHMPLRGGTPHSARIELTRNENLTMDLPGAEDVETKLLEE